MLAYLSLLQKFLSDGKKNSLISGIHLNVTGIATFVLALAAAIMAIVFLMVAFQSWLSMVIDSPYAESLSWLYCALITLSSAGVLLLIARSAKKRHGLIGLTYTPSADQSIIKDVTDELVTHIEQHPLTAVILAGLAGAVAGDRVH